MLSPVHKSYLRQISVILLSTLLSSPAFAAPQSPDALLEKTNAQISNIDTLTLETLLETQPSTVLIDVRTPNEILLRGGMIDAPRSYNIPRGWLEFRIADVVPDTATPIVVYCGQNLRSPLAAASLMAMGYTLSLIHI